MNRKTTRRSSMFLLELVIAIFFFCLVSAVCVRFFVKSHTLTVETKALDMAVNQSTSFAELFRDSDDFLALLEKQYPDGILKEDTSEFVLFYDASWNPCKKAKGRFSIAMQLTSDTDFCTASFTTIDTEAKEEIYALDTGKYTGGGTAQ